MQPKPMFPGAVTLYMALECIISSLLWEIFLASRFVTIYTSVRKDTLVCSDDLDDDGVCHQAR